MDDVQAWDTAVLLLRAATELTDGIQRGVAARGFADVRPAHGFAFVRISRGGATVAELAEHLGVTKQAASQLTELLVSRGYVTRAVDPRDGRGRLLQLTEQGWTCTRAAQQAGAETVSGWQRAASDRTVRSLRTALAAVVTPGPLRPGW